MIKIREVKVSDAGQLQELLTNLINETPPIALELENLAISEKEWINQFPHGDMGHFLVVEVNDKIVGFCYLAIPKYYKPVAYIGMALNKQYRRKGIGSQLFYQVAAWAVKAGLEYIIADVWSWNLRSLKFFEALGFVAKDSFKDKFRGEYREKIRLIKKL